jgi:uncharacterized protein YuzE
MLESNFFIAPVLAHLLKKQPSRRFERWANWLNSTCGTFLLNSFETHPIHFRQSSELRLHYITHIFSCIRQYNFPFACRHRYRPGAACCGYRVSHQQGLQTLERKRMKINYDQETDTLTVIFIDTEVAESDEEKQRVILDYDNSGNLVSLEILEASRRVLFPNQIEYQVTPALAS